MGDKTLILAEKDMIHLFPKNEEIRIVDFYPIKLNNLLTSNSTLHFPSCSFYFHSGNTISF